MENAKEESGVEVDFDATVPGEVETDATGKNILIRDKDASDDTSELKLARGIVARRQCIGRVRRIGRFRRIG